MDANIEKKKQIRVVCDTDESGYFFQNNFDHYSIT